MQVKRYVAPTMRLALKMVRDEVGPDAVILSSKRLNNGVEILTSVEAPEEVVHATTSGRAANDNPFKVDSKKPAPTQAMSPLEQELEKMQRDNQRQARALADSYAKRNAGLHQQVESQSAPSPAPELSHEWELSPKPAFVPEPAPDIVQLTQSIRPAEEVIDVAKAVAEGEMAQMRRELQSMRDMLEQQLSSIAWGNYRQQHPQQASLWRRMKRMGLSARIAHELLEGMPKATRTNERELWQSLMSRLARRVPVVEGDLIAAGGVFALVGPTGAGKTTTIGKLATRYVLEQGSDAVALVTTDTARIAAYEQLRTFGRILNVPVKVVDNHHSLEQVLYTLRHKKLVLVDTAGLNRQDQRLQQQLCVLNELGGSIRTLLTIPATSQKSVIKATYHAFKTDNLAGCILTKLDEAVSVGEVLSLAAEKRLPLAYSTNGQGVPEDISPADLQALIRLAIALARQVGTDDGAMADEVASLALG